MDREHNVCLVSVLSEKEIKNVIPEHVVLGNRSETDGPGSTFGSNQSLSSVSSSSSSSSSSTASSTESSKPSDVQTGIEFKTVKYDGDKFYVITGVPDRLKNVIRENDILWHINGKSVRRMKKKKIRKKLRKLFEKHDPKTLTIRRWKTNDVMTEFTLCFTTKLTKREIRNFKWTTAQPKPKFIQIDCFANKYARVDGDEIVARPFEEPRASSYYFYIWTFHCFIRSDSSQWESHYGFTWSCTKDGQNCDVSSDVTNPSTPNLLRIKPHMPLNENRLDERYFLIHKLSSRESALESLLYKDICVAYDANAQCLVMRSVEKIPSENSNFLYRMFTQTSVEEEITRDGEGASRTKVVTYQKSVYVKEPETETGKKESRQIQKGLSRKSGTVSILGCCFTAKRKRRSSYNLDNHKHTAAAHGRISFSGDFNERSGEEEENDDEIFLISEFIKFVDPKCVTGARED